MFKKTIFALLVLLLFSACGPKPTPVLPTPSEDQIKMEEQAVYAALLKDMFSAPMVVIMENTATDPGGVDNTPSTLESVAKNLPGLESNTVESFRTRNDKSYPVPADMNLGVRYVVLTQTEMNQYFGPNQDGWNAFYKNYPDAPGITSLSRVGFNETYDQALVYEGTQSHYLAGAGYYFLMVKVNGTWTVSIKSMTWIS